MKERLAGAVIVVALAVIVLPALFDGEGYREFSQVRIEAPEKPAIVFGQHFPALEQERGEAGGATGTAVRRAPVKEPLRAAPPVVRDKAVRAPDKAARAPGSAGRAPGSAGRARWVVQAGVFSVRENADSLRATLSKAGFAPVFFKEAQDRRGAPVYFVRIGPHKNRGAAEQIARDLKKKHGITALVRSLGDDDGHGG